MPVTPCSESAGRRFFRDRGRASRCRRRPGRDRGALVDANGARGRRRRPGNAPTRPIPRPDTLPVEIDLVAPVTARVAAVRIPVDEEPRHRRDQQHEGAHRQVVGFTLHAGSAVAPGERSARPVEIRLDPRMRIATMPSSVSLVHLAIDHHADTIADAEDRVQIVRDHDDRQMQFLVQIQDQVIEGRCANRIEPGWARRATAGCGSSASARASAARLTMPPDSCEGNLRAASSVEPTRRSFSIASSSSACGGSCRCSSIGSWTFCSTVSDVNSAPCWKVTP